MHLHSIDYKCFLFLTIMKSREKHGQINFTNYLIISIILLINLYLFFSSVVALAI